MTARAPQTVLLTGASSGIGAATAKLLADEGHRVFGTSRKPSPDASGSVEWLTLDVGDETSVTRAVAELRERAGALDALVCNAGFGIFGSVEEVPLEAAQQQFDTNFFGVLRCLRAVLPDMRERGAGRIVLVGSLAGRAPIPFQAHYSASKAAVEALAWSLANELHGSGVGVSLVEPGDIDTPFNDQMDWGDASRSVYGQRILDVERTIRENLPKAPGPEVVARAILHAVAAPRPRLRYAVGAEAGLVGFGRRLASDGIALRVLRKFFGL